MLFIRLSLILALVAAVASAALALTYEVTRPAIKQAEKNEEQNALRGVFFMGFTKAEPVEHNGIKYYRIFVEGDGQEPSYFALTGQGIGYNKASPLELLVGFENPAAKNAGAAMVGSFVCYGWRVIKSQETPGLGENARDSKPSFTIAGKLTGKPDDESPDRRTEFQAQFSGKAAADMKVKENIHIITGATYSTVGIIDAVKDADKRLQAALAK